MTPLRWEEVLRASQVAARVIRWRDGAIGWMRDPLKRWRQTPQATRWMELWRQRPIQMAGGILVVSVLTNSALCWLLGRRMDPVGIGVRAGLLLLGLLGLKSASHWKEVRDGSFLLKVLGAGSNRRG